MMSLLVLSAFLILTVAVALAGVPTTLADFFLPGSQPQQSGEIKKPTDCDCHGKYDKAVEPMFGWQGGMMSQASRDPLFYAAMSIANQDADFSGDLCIRCHSPKAWLEGRSEPTDGSAMTQDDGHGVLCHFCHKMVVPSPLGVNPYPGDTAYTSTTYPADQTYLSNLDVIPSHSANGMYIVDEIDYRRGPYTDATPPHDFYYSPFHRESALCGTCHDVSNPVYTRQPDGSYALNTVGDTAADFNPYTMFPVERTYSEWLKSSYNSAQGVYAPQFGGNRDTVATCQDCHMRDVTGRGCQQGSTLVRDDLGLHDFTGGNTFVPLMIQTLFSEVVDAEALDSGIVRATYMLQNAATMALGAATQTGGHLLTVTITNETGHKLPSGYPEGRRIWLNVKCYDSLGATIYESGAYDTSSAVLTHDVDVKIYEIKPGISNNLAPDVSLPAGPSFHFVLNDSIYKDNRIPPRGFTNAAFDSIQSPPVAYTYADGQYWDETTYLLPLATAKAVVTLYYQTVSKEYVEFLRDENVTDTTGDLLYANWLSHGKSAPVVMEIDSVSLTPSGTNQPPTAICPENIVTGTDPGECGAIVTFTVSVDDDQPGATVTAAPPSGSFFDVGTTQVEVIAVDTEGLEDTCYFNVTVNDTEPPVAVCPSDTVLQAPTGETGVVVEFSVSFTDNCTGGSVSASPPSGSFFELGNTTVEVVAVDAAALADTCHFQVTVTGDDTDSDGVVDTEDNCPFAYNPNQDDSDTDGVGDSCDVCPGYDDLADSDSDTVPDSCDNCPDDYNPDQEDTDGDDIGNACDGGCCIPPTIGDVNQSGTVDITDISVLIDNQFLTLTPLVCEEEGDLDFSGAVDITDLSILIDNQFLTLTPLPACP